MDDSRPGTGQNGLAGVARLFDDLSSQMANLFQKPVDDARMALRVRSAGDPLMDDSRPDQPLPPTAPQEPPPQTPSDPVPVGPHAPDEPPRTGAAVL